jgi:hypothetical protein
MMRSRRPPIAALAVVMGLITGCGSMEARDFADASPRLVLEEYFDGRTRGWGLFEDRFGTVRRQFVVDIEGTWDGRELVLDEHFTYSDGETDRRVWRITRTGDHGYEGRATDVVGIAEASAYGNAVHWRYELDLKVENDTWRVHFDDWMFLQPDGVLMNRSRVSKFGLDIGEVTLVFRRLDENAEVEGNASAEVGGSPPQDLGRNLRETAK